MVGENVAGKLGDSVHLYSSISTGANNHFPPILRPSEKGPTAGCIGQSPPNTSQTLIEQ